MKRITTLVTAVTLLCLYAAAASAQTPKELDPKVVEAWKKAGAQAGGYWPDRFGGRFSVAKPTDVAALSAIHWVCVAKGTSEADNQPLDAGPAGARSSLLWVKKVHDNLPCQEQPLNDAHKGTHIGQGRSRNKILGIGSALDRTHNAVSNWRGCLARARTFCHYFPRWKAQGVQP